MKKLIYFILSICVICYIAIMIYVAAVPDLHALGAWGEALRYISLYGGVALLFAFAITNFTGNILKIILLVLLILITLFYIFVVAFPDYFADLFGITQGLIS